MANKDYSKNKRSVCEMSMLVVANIIRLSSPKISAPTFTNNLPPPQEERTHVAALGKDHTTSVSKFYKKSAGRQEPERIKMKPEKGDPTTYVRQSLDDVDINAENYISHIREKIRDHDNIEY